MPSLHRAVVLCLLPLAACGRADGDAKAAPPAHVPHEHPQCALIATTLTSFEMGNYAEPEDRAPREAELRAKCAAANLSDAEARCLVDTTQDHLASCPKPLVVAHADVPPPIALDASGLPPACQAYIAVLDRLGSCDKLPVQTRTAMRDSIQQAAQAWRRLDPQGMENVNKTCASSLPAISQSLSSLGCQ